MDTVTREKDLRGAGKTHRMLLQALASAARGEDVVVLGSSMQHITNLQNHTEKICFEAGVTTTRSGLKISLRGEGTLTFLRTNPSMSPSELLKVLGYDATGVWVDHFAQEVALAHLKRLSEEWESLNDGSP